MSYFEHFENSIYHVLALALLIAANAGPAHADEPDEPAPPAAQQDAPAAQQDAPAAQQDAPAAQQDVPKADSGEVIYLRGRAPTMAFSTRMPVPVDELPQSVQIVDREVLNQQDARRLIDVYRNASGAHSYSPYNDIVIRGFRSSESDILFNGQRGNPFNFYLSIALPHIESVEVLKGPSAILFGNGQPGGTINLVSKKPLPEAAYRAELSAATYDTYGVVGDATGPITRDGTWRYRLNLAAEDANSFRDFIESRSFLVAPVVTWQPRKDTTLTVEGMYLMDHRTVGWDRGIVAPGGDLDALPISRFLHEPDDFNRSHGASLQLLANHALGSTASVHLAARFMRRGEDSAMHHLYWSGLEDDGRTLPREYRRGTFGHGGYFLDAYANAQARTGPIGHTMVAGIHAGLATHGWDYQRATGNVPSIDIYEPTYGRGDAATYMVDAYNAVLDERTLSFAVYTQDQLALTSRIKALAGLRYDVYDFRKEEDDRLSGMLRSDDSDAGALTPRIGLVAELTDALSFYGGYSAGFMPQTASMVDMGGPFDPERSRQVELGVKSTLLGGLAQITASGYWLVKYDVLTPDPMDPGRRIQAGEVTSPGVELDVAVRLGEYSRVVANYAFNDASVTEDTTGKIGDRLPNSPRHSGSLWASYRLDRTPLQGLSLGGGLVFVGQRHTTSEVLRLPAYGIVDLALGYTRWSLDFGLSIHNLLDARHVVGSYSEFVVFPGEPRTIRTTVGVRY